MNHMIIMSLSTWLVLVDIVSANSHDLEPKNRALVLENSSKAEQFIRSILSDDSIEVPDHVDWHEVSGRVTPVKDQVESSKANISECWSAWAFATSGVLEGQMAKLNFSLVELSEQNLIDCSTKENPGCIGGYVHDAIDTVVEEGGIQDEKSYPCEDTVGYCRFNPSKVALSGIKGRAILKKGDEEALKQMVAKFGPVAGSVDENGEGFINYRLGVYYNETCKHYVDELHHQILIVGYGTDPEQGNYWIVKNSKSAKWGDKGYIKMSRNKNNNCGIATIATVPVF